MNFLKLFLSVPLFTFSFESEFNKKIKTYNKVERKLTLYIKRSIYKYSKNSRRISHCHSKLRYKVSLYKDIFINKFILDIRKLKYKRDTTARINNLYWTEQEEIYKTTSKLFKFETIT